jgi:hypothetical protein
MLIHGAALGNVWGASVMIEAGNLALIVQDNLLLNFERRILTAYI